MISRKYTMKSKEVLSVHKRSKRINGKLISAKVQFTKDIEHPLFAVIISKKIHKSAVKRNKIKRLILHTIRLMLKQNFFSTHKYLFIVNSVEIENLSISEIERELKSLLSTVR